MIHRQSSADKMSLETTAAPVVAQDAATTHHRKILKDTLFLNGAMTVGQVFAVVQSLLVMRVLDPAGYGIWLGLVILLSYASYVHLGVDDGLGIRLPYYRGQNEERRAIESTNTAYSVWTGLTIVFAIGIGGFALLARQQSAVTKAGLIAVAVLVVLQQQIAFYDRWLSSQASFRRVSTLSTAQSFISVSLIVPLAYALGIYGVMLGTVATSFVMWLLWSRSAGFRASWRFSASSLADLLRVGMPLLLVSLSWTLIKTIDRVLILRLLGPASLGLYGITGIGGNFLYSLMHKAGSAISPHITEEMGRSGDSPEALRKYLIKPTLLFAAASVAGIMLLLFVVPLLVELVLPRYRPGIGAFYLFVPGFFFLGITMTSGNILSVVLMARRRQRFLLYLQGLALATEVGAIYLFVGRGWSLEGVALASTLSYAVYGLSILAGAARCVIKIRAERWSFLGEVLTPFVYGSVVCWALIAAGTRLAPGPTVLMRVVQIVLATVALAPIAWWLENRVGIRQELLVIRHASVGRLRSLRARFG